MSDTPAERVADGSLNGYLQQCATSADPGQMTCSTPVPLEFVSRAFSVIADTPQHTYQVLTKRSTRLRKIADRLEWPPNLWMGVSVEDSGALFRVDDLRAVPAAVRFLSCEPLIGPLRACLRTGLPQAGVYLIYSGA